MSTDGLEPPGCPLPGACSCPGGEAELATRLANAIRERDAAIAQLAAEREAGRREGIEAAAKVADSYDFMHPDTSDDFCKGMASGARSISALIRALRDTPAAPETGKTEGENADG